MVILVVKKARGKAAYIVTYNISKRLNSFPCRSNILFTIYVLIVIYLSLLDMLNDHIQLIWVVQNQLLQINQELLVNACNMIEFRRRLYFKLQFTSTIVPRSAVSHILIGNGILDIRAKNLDYTFKPCSKDISVSSNTA